MNLKVTLVLLLSACLLLMAGCSEEKINAPDPGSTTVLTGDADQAALEAQPENTSDADKCFADVAITAFSAPATVSPGGLLSLSATVINLGARDVNTDFTVRVFDRDSGVTLALRTVHTLPAGEAKSDTVEFIVPAKALAGIQTVAPGVYTLVCKHDYFFDPRPFNNSQSVQVEVLPGGDVGNVVINPDPDVLNAPWSVVGPDKAVYNGNGDFTLTGVPAGDYTVTWGSVPGWIAPAGETLTLAAGGVIAFNGLYTYIPTVGTVVLNPEPDALNAPWSVVGPDKAVYNGNGDFTLVDVPTGDYTVTWGAVAGWTAPAPETLTLTDGATITFTGLYLEIPRVGTVVINPDPDVLNAPWSLSGPGGYLLAGNGDLTIPDLLLGDYTVTWDAVAGWIAPGPETQALTAGGTITFNGLYTEIPTVGTVVLNPDPDTLNAPWSVVGPDKAIYTGNGDFTLVDVPTGDYTVTWGAVAGWTTPAPETLALTDGATITFNGLYVEIIPVGTVVVNPDPDVLNVPWSLSGPGGYLLAGNGDTTIPDLLLGDYTVTWGAVAGWVAPAGETLNLVAGGVITFNGLYVEIIPVGNIMINPSPNEINAPWDLSGPGGVQSGNGDVMLNNQVTGSYTITWLDVAGYETPAPETLTLNESQTIIFAATYTPVGTGETIGFWFDQGATDSCAEGAFLSHVPAYIVYSDPSIASTRGFECGIDLHRVGGVTFNTSMTVTFPLAATNVGVNTPSAGQYNYIVGYAEPLATTTNTVMATMDIFYLEFEALTFDMVPARPASIPGTPVIMRDDFSLFGADIGSPTASLQAPGTCPAKAAGADSFGEVRNLFR